MSELRDPRSFRVLKGSVYNIEDDSLARRILAGGRPEVPAEAVRVYRAGQIVPAGRLSAVAVPSLLARGNIEPTEEAPRVSPAAVALAAELGIDLAVIVGTGKDGVVTVTDVRAAAASVMAQGAPGSDQPTQEDPEPDQPTGGDA